MSESENTVDLPRGVGRREFHIEPFEWYERGRERGPVVYDDSRESWDVFGYHEAREVLSNHELYSNDVLHEETSIFRDTMLGMDPPEHTERRGLVEEYFTREAVETYEDEIRSRVQGLLDDVEGEREFDVVERLAYPLPVMTICDVLGVPDDEWRRFKSWSDSSVAGPLATDDDVERLETERSRAMFETAVYMSELVDERESEPRDDMISSVVSKDHGLSKYELIRMLGLLMVAGNVTTTNYIGNAVWCLGESDVDVDDVSDDEDMRLFLEEVLRYRSPVQLAPRRAREDVTLAGEEIQEDDTVVAWIGAANRDPAVFDDPMEFEPRRSPNPHVAFGGSTHYCLGASLARLETQVAVGSLFERVESLDVPGGERQPVASGFLHGLEALDVTASWRSRP
ncbi:MAG: cytochrome P450 [Halobacteriales archaeon]